VDPHQWQHNASWQHTANWSRGQGAWHHDGAYYRGGYYHFYPLSSASFGVFLGPFWWGAWPFFGAYGYPYYGYPYYGYLDYAYTCYGYPAYGYRGYGYGYTPYEENGLTLYAAAMPPETAATAPVTEETRPTPEEPPSSSEDWGSQFLSSAREAFRSGQYADALRLATHAAVEAQQDPKPHEMMSLALFALADYRGANLEAHAALSLGKASDWPTLYGYYGDLAAYTKHLNALVDYIRAHRDAADARFVLAYHDLMQGHKDAAKAQLEKVLSQVPQDQLAAKLLADLGGKPPSRRAPAVALPDDP
jgi:hypothetical protein